MKIELFLIVVVFASVGEFVITKKGKGYEGIFVAIHKSVPEDPQLIEKIKTIFQNASSLLYKATSSQAFFRDITIVIPDTWSDNPNYQKIYGEYFGSADVRIDTTNPNYGDVPYTLQTGNCGQPGQYIHLTPEYINTVTSGKEHIYGPTDRLLVHEWAHLRYGIFDEYGTAGDHEFPIFYLEGGKVKVSACSPDIRGWVESINGEPCTIHNDYFSANCRFIPDTSNATVVSSLMSFNYLPGVTEFCEKNSNGVRRHNTNAKTKQNKYCSYKSAWEVITSHKDFESMNSVNNEQYVPPIFRVVRPSTREHRFIFVLDISGSMQGNRINFLHTATVKLIEDTIPNVAESSVAIVAYESTARVVQPLVKITQSNKKAVSANVPSRAYGGTAMGQGLQAALKLLRDTKQPTDGAVIILVSDGEENVAPYSNLILPELVAAKVIVHSIAIGIDASRNLEKIAEATGGKSYYFQDNAVLTTHLDGILESTIEQHVDLDLKKEQLIRKEYSITSTIEEKVTMDKELGNNTVFTVSGQIQNVQLEAYGPKGERYDHTSAGYNKDTGIKSRIQLQIPFTEPGVWTLKLVKTDTSNIKVDFSVTSEPRNIHDQPLRVVTYLGDELVSYPKEGNIYARVTKGNKIVIRATVTATVNRPGSAPVQLQLLDDGINGDLVKNDGIYSRYFTRFTTNGRYSFSVTLKSKNGSTLAVRPRYSFISPLPIKSSTGMRLNVDPANEFNVKLFKKVVQNDAGEVEIIDGEEIGDAERSEEGLGVLVVTDVTKEDKMPPNKVTDLKVIGSDITKNGDMIFTIDWTSPGDNMDDGNATSLDIRISVNSDNLKKDKFPTSFKLNETHLVEGKIAPVPGREKQRIVVKVPEEILSKIKPSKSGSSVAIDIFIALRAADANNNTAEISNIVAVHFGYDIPELVTTTTTVSPPTPDDRRNRIRRINNKLLLSLVVDLDHIDEL